MGPTFYVRYTCMCRCFTCRCCYVKIAYIIICCMCGSSLVGCSTAAGARKNAGYRYVLQGLKKDEIGITGHVTYMYMYVSRATYIHVLYAAWSRVFVITTSKLKIQQFREGIQWLHTEDRTTKTC